MRSMVRCVLLSLATWYEANTLELRAMSCESESGMVNGWVDWVDEAVYGVVAITAFCWQMTS